MKKSENLEQTCGIKPLKNAPTQKPLVYVLEPAELVLIIIYAAALQDNVLGGGDAGTGGVLVLDICGSTRHSSLALWNIPMVACSGHSDNEERHVQQRSSTHHTQ